jgi:hypothetical protein
MVPGSLRFHALSNGYGLSLTLSYEKNLLGKVSLLAVKTKEDSSHQAVAPRQPLERSKHGRQYDENNIFSFTERTEVCSIITEAGLMMCADEHTHTLAFQNRFVALINTAY